MKLRQTTGPLIILEGPDGAGKSALAAAYVHHLRVGGESVALESFPGKTVGSLGHLVYQLHHDPNAVGVDTLTPESLQALHVAAHLDTIDRVIRPKIQSGETVVLDRFWWSTWVYGVDAHASEATLAALIEAERAHWGSLVPAVVLLISRNDSHRPEESGDSWRRKMKLYEEVAEREKTNYAVRRVANDDTIELALQRVMEAVEAARAVSASPSGRAPSQSETRVLRAHD